MNQYSSRTNLGAFDVIGLAISTNGVNVNGSAVPYRRGEYYWAQVTVANGSNPVWQMVTNSSGSSNVIGGVLVPPTNQAMQYDADGNLTNDLVWNYIWDAENRLIRMTNTGTLTASNRLQVAFEYDWKGRRIRKTVTRLETSNVILDYKFLYDGWNLIAELNGTNNSIIRNYVWGTDLSGSMQGAGGVGGLLKMANYTPSATNYFVAYDGNGNVAGLIHADLGTNMVIMEYGPFGEPIRSSGVWSTAAKTCPIRFSSKYTDDETDLVYYGYRYYNSSTGRWPSRDPIGERGGKNLYALLSNNALNTVDALGLADQIKAKDNTQIIVVGHCEVVVLNGEGYQSHPHKFIGPTENCWGGGFIGCFAGETNKRLKPENQIPGSPDWTDYVFENEPEYRQAWTDIQKGAREKADSICKNSKCKCKKVLITYRYAPAYDLKDFKRPALPEDQTIKCN